MWQSWDWSFMKSQVDDAVALGANSVRLIGCIPVVTTGLITRTTYLNQWTQFLDYCQGLGLSVLPTGGSLAYWGATTVAQAGDELAAWAALVDTRSCVIGLDVTNECFAAGAVAGLSSSQTMERVTVLNARVRAATTKAITNSRTCHSLGRWDHQEGAWLDPLSDFHSVHSYYTMAPTDPQSWMSKWWGSKPILLGEFGAALDLTAAQRTARYEAARQLVLQNPRFVGAMAWAVRDIAAGNANAWGLVDETRTPRTDIASTFALFPDAD